MKRLLFAISLSSLLVAFAAETPAATGEKAPPRTFGAEYVNYVPGRTLVYQTSFGESQTHVEEKGGITYISNDADRFRYHQQLLVDSAGVRITQVYQKLRILAFITKENTVTYDRPVMRIPFPLTEGKSWNWKGTEYSDGDGSHLDVTGQIVGVERIVVPAGTFDALKIETTMKSESGSVNTIREWYAPNIGMVKTLVSIQGGGITGMVRDLLGYGEIKFELEKIVSKKI